MKQAILERGVVHPKETTIIRYKLIKHNEVTCFQRDSFPEKAAVVLYIEGDKVVAIQHVKETKEQYFQDCRGKEWLTITKTP